MSSRQVDESAETRAVPTPGLRLAGNGLPRRPLQVGLVGASDLVARGLAAMMETCPGRVELVEEALLLPSAVDVVLVDVSLDADTAVTRVRRLARAGFPVVLVFGWSLGPAEMTPFLAAGAHGDVSMRLGTADLMSVLDAAGPASVAPWPPRADGSSGQASALIDLGCSDREVQVVMLICQGLSNAEIAAALFLSPGSVKSYIRGAYRKIGLRRRSQVVVWGLTHGL